MVIDIQTDLPPHDATLACAEAIDDLGWRVEAFQAYRIVTYADSGSTQHPLRIEVVLNDAGPTTDIRIIGSDTEADPFAVSEALIAELSRVRDAIKASVESATEASGIVSAGPAEAELEPAFPHPSVNRLGLAIALLGAVLAGISVFLPTADAASITSNRLENNTLIQAHTGACIFIAAIVVFSLFFGLRNGPRARQFRARRPRLEAAAEAMRWRNLWQRWGLVVVTAVGFAKALSSILAATSLRKFYPIINGHADMSVKPEIADPGTGLILLVVGFGLLLAGALIIASEGARFVGWLEAQAKRLPRLS